VKEGKQDNKTTLEATVKLPANSTNQKLKATLRWRKWERAI